MQGTIQWQPAAPAVLQHDAAAAGCGVRPAARPASHHAPTALPCPTLQVVVRGKAGRSGLKGVTAVATLTHEFEL